jgi:hypothetical protein
MAGFGVPFSGRFCAPADSLIREWLREVVTDLHCIGRNGQRCCNNQDHSMATALIAGQNVVLGHSRDPWAVNEDAKYRGIAKTERQAPITLAPVLASQRHGL